MIYRLILMDSKNEKSINKKKNIYTLGLYGMNLRKLKSLANKYDINEIIDIRLNSDKNINPHLTYDMLKEFCISKKIIYKPDKDLAKRFPAKNNSENKGWSNRMFRGYADYMQTKQFTDSINSILYDTKKYNVLLVDSPKLQWESRISLVADALSIRSKNVYNIIDGIVSKHKLTSFAKVSGLKITYPKYKSTSIKRFKSKPKKSKPKSGR